MATYRAALPQTSGDLFLTDGGLEATLALNNNLKLPHGAAFHALGSSDGYASLRAYYETYADLAYLHSTGLILESPTWRANPDWGKRLDYSASSLAVANQRAILLLCDVRKAFKASNISIVISGCVGPRHGAYASARTMSVIEAEHYHCEQIGTFADTAADMISALTMHSAEEAAGVACAAQAAGMPVALSFNVGSDGELHGGGSLRAAIEYVDEFTSGYPAYYMVDCAHPAHFAASLTDGGNWTRRLRGLRAHASATSYAEVDQGAELDTGDPTERARLYADLVRQLPNLNVLGGCCGTDNRHLAEIAKQCLPYFRHAA